MGARILLITTVTRSPFPWYSHRIIPRTLTTMISGLELRQPRTIAFKTSQQKSCQGVFCLSHQVMPDTVII